MMKKSEEDEYWNSSKFRAFTFDDEDDEFSRLKESRQAIRRLAEEDEDEDEVEKVSWSGEPIGSKDPGRAPETRHNQTEPHRTPQNQTQPDRTPQNRTEPDRTRHNQTEPHRTPQNQTQPDRTPQNQTEPVRTRNLRLTPAASFQVLIHLKRTLSKDVLFAELRSRQTALRHFVQYLTETRDQDLLLELLRSLNRTEDVALLQYREQLSLSDAPRRRDFLKTCLSLPFSADDLAHIQDQHDLLDRQILIEVWDREGKLDVFRKFPRKASILNMPVITTLYYCCLYHYSEQGTFSSPSSVRQTFKLSEKQYFVTALAARAKLKAWTDVDALFSSRNWLGFTRKRAPISFQRVVDILHRNSAPSQVLQDYIGLVDDPQQRVSLASRHRCHDVVINTYRDMKDRQLLLGYRAKVERGSAAERKIDELLSQPQIRWKN
uniref:Spermatogenesis-defective protein 39 homolog n=1 Tax=Salarias fasciatus TaxID=181472 RepID=A0A672FN53_SALFA